MLSYLTYGQDFEKTIVHNALFFGLLKPGRCCLDSRGVVGTILMNLSKAYDCMLLDLLIKKLEAYGLDRNSLSLMLSYLSNRIQRVRIGIW